MSESPAPFDDDLYEGSASPSHERISRNINGPSLSPSPAASSSSDKENRTARPPDKGKGRVPMGPPSIPTSAQSGQSKRKRTVERDASVDRTRRRRTVEVDETEVEADDYDPDQDMEERRRLRKDYREETRKLAENRAEYMNPTSTGIRDALLNANNLSNNVKQTSDATIDSRLLVNVAELAYKKTLVVVSGDMSQGIDIEDFISRCTTYMRQADGGLKSQQVPSSTQRRTAAVDDEDTGDAYNWEHLGRHACLPYNLRPSVPSFLLGPLSVEKRARKVIVRKAALRPNKFQQTQPELLKAGDVKKVENENLTTLCTQIHQRLQQVIESGMAAVEAQNYVGISKQEISELYDKYGLSQECGMALFKFVVNPDSFGQTIENMFYVSFLIRDGKVGISYSDDGMPHLDIIAGRDSNEAPADGVAKHQAVLALDIESWEDIIDVFDMQGKPSMIMHREEADHNNVGGKGWYA